jgi:hypothetical protein
MNIMHLLRDRNISARAARFASMAVLAAGIMASCVDSSGTVGAGEGAGSASDVSSALRIQSVVAPPKPITDSKKFELGFTVGCPDLMVRAGNYCIDRFEAYVVELKGGQEVPHPHSLPPKGKTLKAKVAYNAFPQSAINQFQAKEACENAGKRLCTLHEWISACAGVENFKYPYGNVEQKKKCNTRKSHLVTELHGNDPKKWGNGMNDPLLNFIPGFLSRTGLHPECVSSFGAEDMVGNLHEWVSTLVGKGVGSRKVTGKTNPIFKTVPGNGIFMGGFYSTANENGEGCHYMTTVHGPDQDDYSVGFRCCSDAK